jgi:hypothetical protein
MLVNFLPFASYACKIRNNLPLSLRRDVAEILLKVALNTNQSLCPLTSKIMYLQLEKLLNADKQVMDYSSANLTNNNLIHIPLFSFYYYHHTYILFNLH